MANPTISQLFVGTTLYDIKDQKARDDIAALGHPLKFVGVTTTQLTDGSTTNPITVDGASYTATKGDVVIVNGTDQEFFWTGSAWESIGDASSFVVKGTYTTNQANANITATVGTDASESLSGHPFEGMGETYTPTGTFTPKGTISAPTFTGTAGTVTVTGPVSAQDIAIAETTNTAVAQIDFGFTPGGNINIGATTTESSHTFVGEAGTVSVTGSGTPFGTVDASVMYGSVSGHNFSGTEATINVQGQFTLPLGGVDILGANLGTSSGHLFHGTSVTLNPTGTFTPEGDVSVSVSGSGSTATVVTGVSGGQGSLDYVGTVGGEVLYLGQAVMTVSAVTTNTVSALTGYSLSTPTASFTGTAGTVSVSQVYTPGGSVDGAHALTTTPVEISASTVYTPQGSVTGSHRFTGQTLTIASSGTFTPAGSVTGSHSFSGTKTTLNKRLVAKLVASSFTATGTFTPAGTISAPTFTGTAGTVTTEVNITPKGVVKNGHTITITQTPHTHDIVLGATV